MLSHLKKNLVLSQRIGTTEPLLTHSATFVHENIKKVIFQNTNHYCAICFPQRNQFWKNTEHDIVQYSSVPFNLNIKKGRETTFNDIRVRRAQAQKNVVGGFPCFLKLVEKKNLLPRILWSHPSRESYTVSNDLHWLWRHSHEAKSIHSSENIRDVIFYEIQIKRYKIKEKLFQITNWHGIS